MKPRLILVAFRSPEAKIPDKRRARRYHQKASYDDHEHASIIGTFLKNLNPLFVS